MAGVIRRLASGQCSATFRGYCARSFSQNSAGVSSSSSSRLAFASTRADTHQGGRFLTPLIFASLGVAAGSVAGCGVEESPQERFYVAPSSESKIKVFCGTGNTQLANEVAMHLGTQLGRATVRPFADGEINVQLHDNVRGKKVYIIQPTCPPVDRNLMELLLMVTALRRASAKEITAVIPYYGYSRSTQTLAGHKTIAGADVARMLEIAGVDRVIAVDLHKGQIQGFFSPKVPVDNLDISGVALPYLQTKFLQDPVVVAPDANGTQRAKNFADKLLAHHYNASFAMVVDSKSPPDDEEMRSKKIAIDTKVYELVGEVRGRDCVIVDDIVDSGRRLERTSIILKQHGARRIFAFATHGLFTGDSIERLEKAPLIEVVVTNTVPLADNNTCSKIQQLSASALLAETIRRVHGKTSISELMR